VIGTVMSDFINGLKDWQTLLAGAFAIVGGYFALLGPKLQMKGMIEQEQLKEKRMLFALARALKIEAQRLSNCATDRLKLSADLFGEQTDITFNGEAFKIEVDPVLRGVFEGAALLNPALLDRAERLVLRVDRLNSAVESLGASGTLTAEIVNARLDAVYDEAVEFISVTDTVLADARSELKG
jgi:hypothetical protein